MLNTARSVITPQCAEYGLNTWIFLIKIWWENGLRGIQISLARGSKSENQDNKHSTL